MKTLLSTIFLFSLGFLAPFGANATIYEFTEGNHIELMKDPAESIADKIALIRAAKHHVHIATYFWDDSNIPQEMAQELLNANARGVEVRILSSYIPSVSTDIFGKGRKALKAPYRKTPFIFLTLKPAMGFTLYHNIHEKIFIVDGQVAVIGGRNVSDSSLAGKDLEILTKGPLVHQLQLHFQKLFTFISDLEIEDACKKKDFCKRRIKKLQFKEDNKEYYPEIEKIENGIKARLLSHDALMNYKKFNYSKEERLKQPDDIIDVITAVKFKKLIGYSYFMTLSRPFIKFLNDNLKDNNEITLITNSIESAKFSSNKGYIYSLPIAKGLVEKGLELFQWNREQKLNYVHEKLLIFDEEHIFVGSHNFGTGSTTVSNEIMIEFFSKEIADDLKAEFQNELTDSKVTVKATETLLKNEMEQNQKLLNFLNKESVSKILNEIY